MCYNCRNEYPVDSMEYLTSRGCGHQYPGVTLGGLTRCSIMCWHIVIVLSMFDVAVLIGLGLF